MQIPPDARAAADEGESAALFKGLLESANTLVIVADETGRVRYVGERCARLIGLAREEVVDRLTVLDCVAKEDSNDVADLLAAARDAGQAEGRFSIVAAGGQQRRMEATATGVNTPRGRRVLIVARDVSDLHEARERLGAIVDAQHAVWKATTPGEAVTVALAAFHDHLTPGGGIAAYLLRQGTRRLELATSLGHPSELDDYVRNHTVSVDLEENYITRAFKGGGGIQVLRFSDDPMDERLREILLARGFRASAAMPLETLKGDAFGVLVVGFARDLPTKPDGTLDDPGVESWMLVVAQEVGAIAERALQEERLKVALASERRFAEEFETFAYRASHDLSEPLRRIGTLAGYARDDVASGRAAAAEEELAHIIEASSRLKSMINRLLELSRISRGSLQLSRWRLSDVSREVVDDLSLLCVEREARAILEAPMPMVAANRERVYIALLNLVENAIVHNTRSERPHVWVSAERRSDGFVEVSVRDNGPGIAEEDRERVFDLFHRGPVTAERGGVGAGLTVARRAIQQEGGAIWVSEAPDGGTDVRFTVPADPIGE